MRKLGLSAVTLAAMVAVAPAADYPDHPIRFIVPQAAGSARRPSNSPSILPATAPAVRTASRLA